MKHLPNNSRNNPQKQPLKIHLAVSSAGLNPYPTNPRNNPKKHPSKHTRRVVGWFEHLSETPAQNQTRTPILENSPPETGTTLVPQHKTDSPRETQNRCRKKNQKTENPRTKELIFSGFQVNLVGKKQKKIASLVGKKKQKKLQAKGVPLSTLVLSLFSYQPSCDISLMFSTFAYPAKKIASLVGKKQKN